MGMREVRLCDKVDMNGACQKPFKRTCPLCEQDCCAEHIGAATIACNMNAPGGFLAYFSKDICTGCAKQLEKRTGVRSYDLQHLIDPLIPVVIQAVRALLAAAALAETKK